MTLSLVVLASIFCGSTSYLFYFVWRQDRRYGELLDRYIHDMEDHKKVIQEIMHRERFTPTDLKTTAEKWN